MAANTGIIDGGDIMVYRNAGTDQAPDWDPVAHAKTCSIENTTEMRTRATKDTGQYDEQIPTKQQTTITVDALTTYGAAGNYFSLRALQLARTKVMLKYSGRTAQDVTDGKASLAEQVGDKYEQGYFYITKLSRNDAKDEDSTLNVTFSNTGAIEIKEVAAP